MIKEQVASLISSKKEIIDRAGYIHNDVDMLVRDCIMHLNSADFEGLDIETIDTFKRCYWLIPMIYFKVENAEKKFNEYIKQLSE